MHAGANDVRHRGGAAVLLYPNARDCLEPAGKLLVVLRQHEVAQLLAVITCSKHQAALSIAKLLDLATHDQGSSGSSGSIRREVASGRKVIVFGDGRGPIQPGW